MEGRADGFCDTLGKFEGVKDGAEDAVYVGATDRVGRGLNVGTGLG